MTVPHSSHIPAFSAQFAVPPAVATAAYRPVPRGCDLDRLCAFPYARQVAADNTVRVVEVRLQLLPRPRRRSYAKAHADVVQCLDGSWRVYVGDRLVATLPARPGATPRPETVTRGRTFSLTHDTSPIITSTSISLDDSRRLPSFGA